MKSLLNTKIQVPQLPAGLIERPRLLHLLDHCLTHPLTLLAAPAGFGKTTLLCQWLETLHRTKHQHTRAAWVSLSENDANLLDFLSYFLAALQKVYPNSCKHTHELLTDSQLVSDEALLISLVNELDELGETADAESSEQIVLVLDDYHLVNKESVNRLLDAIVKHPPARLHLVLNCRFDPTLPLARWRTQKRLLEIRSDDLRLNRAEVEQFLRRTKPIAWTKEQPDQLDLKTEGWPAGLHLLSLAVQDTSDAERISKQLGAPNRHIIHYLVDEVLAHLPPPMRAHLPELSILNRFSAELCEAVCADLGETGAEFIKEIQAAGLFVTTLDESGTWFRFHHLFQDLLQNQLKQRTTAQARTELHKRALRWFAAHDYVEDALTHALAAGDYEDAIDLVAQHRYRLINLEQWRRLEQWLEMFPDDIVSRSAELLMTKAWLARTLNFDLVGTVALIEQATHLLSASNGKHARSAALRGEAKILQAVLIYHTQTDAPRVIRLTSEALEAVPVEAYMLRSQAYIFLGGGFQMQGEPEKMLQVMRGAQTEESLSGFASRSRALRCEALLHWSEGNLLAILECTKRTKAQERDEGFGDTTVWTRYLIAAASYERNDLDRAELEAAATLNDPAPIANFRAHVDCALILSFVYQARNMPGQAREVLEDALGWVMGKNSPMLAEVVRAFQARLAVRQGDMVTANRWLAGFGNPTPAGAMANFSSPFITVARVLVAQNTPESRREATSTLTRLEAHMQAIHNKRFLLDVLALQALLHAQEGDQQGALVTLKRALTLAEPNGFIRPFVDLGEPMEKLVRRLTHQDRNREYLKTLLSAFPAPTPKPLPADALIEPLSDREAVVLELLAKRFSNKEIAHELIISPLTVKAHTEHIYQKLGVNSRQDAVKIGESLGLIKPLAR